MSVAYSFHILTQIFLTINKCCRTIKKYCLLMKTVWTLTNLPVNGIVRVLHLRNGDSHGQETYLAPSADKQTCNYDTQCSNQDKSSSY